MPLDLEANEERNNALANADVNLSYLAQQQADGERDLLRWRVIQSVVEAESWQEVKACYTYEKYLLDEQMGGERRISPSRLIEMRGQLQILRDIISLDKQAADKINSISSNLESLRQKIEAGTRAANTIKSRSQWIPQSVRSLFART